MNTSAIQTCSDDDWNPTAEEAAGRKAWDGRGAFVLVDLCHGYCSNILDMSQDIFAFVDRSITHGDGRTTFHVMLFQDHFAGMEGVTRAVARVLEARGRVGQYMGNPTQPTTMRGIVTVGKDQDLSDISKEVHRQLVQPLGVVMGRSPRVVMLQPFGLEE